MKFAEVSIGHTVEIVVTGVSPEAEFVAEVGGQDGAAGLQSFSFVFVSEILNLEPWSGH